MRVANQSLLVIVAGVSGAAPVALGGTISNGSFESGAIDGGWTELGNGVAIGILGSGTRTVAPTHGDFQAYMTTTGAGIAIWNNLEAHLGLSSGTLNATSPGPGGGTGSVIQQEITVDAGDTLTFDWNYFTNDGTIADVGFFSVSTAGFQDIVANMNPLSAGSSGPTNTVFAGGRTTGYQAGSYTFVSGGTYKVGFGVISGDSNFASGLLVDNVAVVDGGVVIPLPSAAGLGVCGLGVIGLRRRRATRAGPGGGQGVR